MRKGLLYAVFMVTLLAMMIPAMPVKANPDPVLVGRWHLDEGEGIIAGDSSGYNNYGTLYDADPSNLWGTDLNTPPAWTTGVFKGALDFDGVDDYVEMSYAIVGTTHFTIEAWINPSSIAPGHYPPRWVDIIVTGNNVPAYSWYLGLCYGDKLCLWYYGAGWIVLGSVAINQWQHVAVVINGASGVTNNLKGYINGINTYTGTIHYTLSTTTSKPWIGSRSDYATYAGWFDGIIDEVRIYNMVLQPQVIALHSLGVYGWAWLKPSKIGPGLPPRETEAGATLPLKFALYDVYGNFFSVPTGTIEMNLYKGTDLDAYGWAGPPSGGPRPAMGLPTVTYNASTLIGSTATSTFPHVSEYGSDYLLSISSDTYIVNWHTNIKPDPDDYYLAVFSWATGTSFGDILTGTFYWWNTYTLTTK